MSDENPFNRIIADLKLWAACYEHREHLGYPAQSNFVTERVQSNNRSTDTYREIPADIVRLNGYIEDMPEISKAVLVMQYREKGTASVKAAKLRSVFPSMHLSVYSIRLSVIHENLSKKMYGEEVQNSACKAFINKVA